MHMLSLSLTHTIRNHKHRWTYSTRIKSPTPLLKHKHAFLDTLCSAALTDGQYGRSSDDSDNADNRETEEVMTTTMTIKM